MVIVISKIKLSNKSNKKISNISIYKNINNINKSTIKYILALTGQSLFSEFKNFKKNKKKISKDYIINKKFIQINKFFGKEYNQKKFIKKKKLTTSSSIKSFKFKFGLPVHNQRTHSNAETSQKFKNKKL